MSDRYAVVGNPIAHSKSPDIHAQFAIQTQQDLIYDKKLIALDDFEKDVTAFFAEGGKGLNVTVPFKENAYRFAERLTARAQLAGAVNTLAKQSDGSILGDTTDGLGLVNDLKNNGFGLYQKRILIVGAGGAVRGVLEPLLAEKPAYIVIANRTQAKAQELAELFKNHGTLQARRFTELNKLQFDTIINGTSASLNGELPPIPGSVFASGPDTGAYDMMYGKGLTPFLLWAQANNVQLVCDGLGMLVGQAAEAFKLWRGIMPDVAPVIERLRKS